jgi:anthranilate/para-aminobenzoate synthase component I
MGDEVICSASPELFLEIDAAARRIVTRPMKGTRRGSSSVAELELSAKDTAELNMITDLMRNDLGRVCELGSVRVERAREVERHGNTAIHRYTDTAIHEDGETATHEGGLWQATSMVSGMLRGGIGMSEILAATFPGGSITGAPKIRAMQIISELEGRERGVYCGAIGFVSRSGHAAFNVAIRTATISGGVVSYGVGAGIVADSEPGAEWRETMDKAGVFLRAAGVGP